MPVLRHLIALVGRLRRARSPRWRAIRGRRGRTPSLAARGQLDAIEVRRGRRRAGGGRPCGWRSAARSACRAASGRRARRACRAGTPRRVVWLAGCPIVVAAHRRPSRSPRACASALSRPSSFSLVASSTPKARGDTSGANCSYELARVVGARQIARRRRPAPAWPRAWRSACLRVGLGLRLRLVDDVQPDAGRLVAARLAARHVDGGRVVLVADQRRRPTCSRR